MALTLDRPNVRMRDSAWSVANPYTNDGTLLAPTNLVPGGMLMYSVTYCAFNADGSLNPASMRFSLPSLTYTPPARDGSADGMYMVTVLQFDPRNPSQGSIPQPVLFFLDTKAAAAPNIALVSDSGISATDGITNNAAIATSGVEAGARVQYRVFKNGNLLNDWNASYAAPASGGAADGNYTVEVRQTDRAGNASATKSISFTFDTTTPVALNAKLSVDSGVSASDGITNNAALTAPTNAEVGARVEYAVSKDGGAFGAWSTTYVAPTVDGLYAVKVRQTDRAGNMGVIQTINFTLDQQAMAAPELKLVADTGNATDHLTSLADLSVSKVEAGALVEYRVKNGTGSFGAWTGSYTAPTVDGSYTVEVRQTDKAGNVSASNSINFTLDKTAPVTPNVRFETDATMFFATTGALVAPTNLEAGAHLEYKIISNGYVSLDWESTYHHPTVADLIGSSPTYAYAYYAEVRQVDAAGNISSTNRMNTVFLAPLNLSSVATFDASVGTETGLIDGTVGNYGYTYDHTLKLTGKATGGTTVQIYDHAATLLGSTTASADGSWTFTTDTLQNDTHVFSALLSDSTGRVTGNLTGPTITVTDPLVTDHPWQGARSGWGLLDALKGINLATGQHLADLQAPASNDALNVNGYDDWRVTQNIENVYDAWQYGYTGKGIVVAHIEGDVDLTKSYIAKGLSPYSWNFEKNSADVQGGGHGNLSIEGLLNVAPDVTHLEIAPASFGDFAFDRCIRYAVDHGARIITTSAHSVGKYAGWKSEITPETLQYAKEHDVLIVASAGYGDYPHGSAYLALTYENVIAANYSWDLGGIPNTPGGALAGDVPCGLVVASGGTNSETAGTVGGFAALILQANPNLTAVELSHILQQATVPVL